MVVIETQYMENYGSAEDPYWKMKGGSSYKITGVPADVPYDEVVDMVRDEIEYVNEFTEQYIIGEHVEADDYMSDFEKSQLEYEGEILYKEPEIEYSDLIARYA